jgi:hypothetical protein
MRGMKFIPAALVSFIMTAMITVNLNAYCFSAWCEKVPQNQIFLNPVLSGKLDGVSYTDWEFIIGFGVAKNIDFYFSTDQYGIIRYDFSGNDMAIVGLEASSADFALEFHGVYPLDPSILIEFNASLTMQYGSVLETPVFNSIVAPVFKLSPDFSLFVEFIPTYSFASNGGLSMQFVPGITLFDGAFTFAVPIELTGSEIQIGYGAMIGIGFDIPQTPEETEEK